MRCSEVWCPTVLPIAVQHADAVCTDLDELLKLLGVGQFGVAIQEEGGVVTLGQALIVEGLQVGREVLYLLGIQVLHVHARAQRERGREGGRVVILGSEQTPIRHLCRV